MCTLNAALFRSVRLLCAVAYRIASHRVVSRRIASYRVVVRRACCAPSLHPRSLFRELRSEAPRDYRAIGCTVTHVRLWRASRMTPPANPRLARIWNAPVPIVHGWTKWNRLAPRNCEGFVSYSQSVSRFSELLDCCLAWTDCVDPCIVFDKKEKKREKKKKKKMKKSTFSFRSLRSRFVAKL